MGQVGWKDLAKWASEDTDLKKNAGPVGYFFGRKFLVVEKDQITIKDPNIFKRLWWKLTGEPKGYQRQAVISCLSSRIRAEESVSKEMEDVAGFLESEHVGPLWRNLQELSKKVADMAQQKLRQEEMQAKQQVLDELLSSFGEFKDRVKTLLRDNKVDLSKENLQVCKTIYEKNKESLIEDHPDLIAEEEKGEEESLKQLVVQRYVEEHLSPDHKDLKEWLRGVFRSDVGGIWILRPLMEFLKQHSMEISREGSSACTTFSSVVDECNRLLYARYDSLDVDLPEKPKSNDADFGTQLNAWKNQVEEIRRERITTELQKLKDIDGPNPDQEIAIAQEPVDTGGKVPSENNKEIPFTEEGIKLFTENLPQNRSPIADENNNIVEDPNKIIIENEPGIPGPETTSGKLGKVLDGMHKNPEPAFDALLALLSTLFDGETPGPCQSLIASLKLLSQGFQEQIYPRDITAIVDNVGEGNRDLVEYFCEALPNLILAGQEIMKSAIQKVPKIFRELMSAGAIKSISKPGILRFWLLKGASAKLSEDQCGALAAALEFLDQQRDKSPDLWKVIIGIFEARDQLIGRKIDKEKFRELVGEQLKDLSIFLTNNKETIMNTLNGIADLTT